MFRSLLKALRAKNQLAKALDLTDQALGKAQALTTEVFGALLEAKAPEGDIYATDREINRAEMQVRRLVFEQLLLNPETDMTPGLVLTSTIIDIERIGDYAKNLYELSQRYPQPFTGNPHFDRVREAAGEVLELFPQARAAFREGDAKKAEAVMTAHAALGRRLDTLLDALVADESVTAREALVAALSARYCKRISAHLSNLASSVVNPFDRIGFRPGHGNADQEADD